MSEAEHLMEIEDDGGYCDEYPENIYLCKSKFIEHKQNRFSKEDVGMYVIVQEPKLNRDLIKLLYLADRSKTKDFWWTHDASYAMKFMTKEAAKKQAAKYKFNRPKIMVIK